MGLRVLATLLVTFISIVWSFRDAFYGLIGYAFWSYTYPEKSTWGFLPLHNLSYVMGLVLVWTTFMQRRRLFTNDNLNKAVIIFWFLCLASVVTAGMTDLALWQFKFFTRIILISLIITMLVDDRKRFRYYLWAIVIFIGLIAARSGIIGTLRGDTGGASSGFQGVIGDRNFMAVILCTAIPIVFFMVSVERNKWLKLLLLITLAGDVMALILTYARAGFAGLLAIGVFAILKSKRKVLVIVLAIIIVPLFIKYFVTGTYTKRMGTIGETARKEGDVDSSVAGRLAAWKSAFEMIKDRPLTGVGFYNSESMMEKYPDPDTGRALPGKAIHNSIIQVAAEAGVPALLLFLGIFVTGYRRLGKIKKLVSKGLVIHKEIWDYASMLQVSFVGYFACGFFVNAAFLDLPWHLVALSIALGQIADKEMAKTEMPAA